MDTKEIVLSVSAFAESGFSYKDDIMLFHLLSECAGLPKVKSDHYALFVCLGGHANLNIMGGDHSLSAGTLLVCRPNVFIDKSNVSPDFECRGMVFSQDFVEQMALVSGGGWDVRMYLSKNPVVPLSQHEIDLFLQYYDLFQLKISSKPCRHQDDVMQSLFKAFVLEFFDLLDRYVNVSAINYTSSDNIFSRFIKILEADYPRQRSVEHYAGRLCISAKYLSSVCKTVSGRTASEIINKCVTDDIRQLLSHADKSIKEVAFELGFPNLSFFGKFVKRRLGMSPKEYRKSLSAPRSVG